MSRPALVIDDEPAMRLLLRDYLEVLGYAADCAEDGRSALAYARSRSYDLALVDVSLPDVSGLEVIRDLRTLAPGLRCVVVSGNLRERHDAELDALGVTHYLEKPIALETLRAAVSDAGQAR
jgi:two-component system NtrC family response regulator